MLKGFGYTTVAIGCISLFSSIVFAVVIAKSIYLNALLVFLFGIVSFIVLTGLGLMMVKVEELSISSTNAESKPEAKIYSTTHTECKTQNPNQKESPEKSTITSAKVLARRANAEQTKSKQLPNFALKLLLGALCIFVAVAFFLIFI